MIRKAVFPVAGLGTRMLPATKVVPKEMLPVVDRPLVQYAFEEARAAGIEQFIFVTGRGKSDIEDHFDRTYELDDVLTRKDKLAELEAVAGWLPAPGELSYTRQPEYHGPGRGCGNSVNALLDAWLLTDQPHYLAKAEALIRRTIHPGIDIAGASNLKGCEPRHRSHEADDFLGNLARRLPQ